MAKRIGSAASQGKRNSDPTIVSQTQLLRKCFDETSRHKTTVGNEHRKKVKKRKKYRGGKFEKQNEGQRNEKISSLLPSKATKSADICKRR